jgi:hypothetical protein
MKALWSVITPFYKGSKPATFKSIWQNDMIVIYFLSMSDIIFVGVDIGGTLTKVCLAAQKLDVSPSFQSKQQDMKSIFQD